MLRNYRVTKYALLIAGTMGVLLFFVVGCSQTVVPAETSEVAPPAQTSRGQTTPNSPPAQPPISESTAPGESQFLDGLWVQCEDGDFAACDELFFEAPAGSVYERFGDTCGYRNDPSGYCNEIYNGSGSSSAGYGEYGSDPELDILWDECAYGDLAACDLLYDLSPAGSDYEFFAETCGGLNEPTEYYCEDLYY